MIILGFWAAINEQEASLQQFPFAVTSFIDPLLVNLRIDAMYLGIILQCSIRQDKDELLIIKLYNLFKNVSI